MALTRDDVVRILGPVDDQIVAQVIGLDPTSEELTEAQAWVANDEPMMGMGRPMATGRVRQLVEILESVEDQVFGTEER
jgi:hypothetical protein